MTNEPFERPLISAMRLWTILAKKYPKEKWVYEDVSLIIKGCPPKKHVSIDQLNKMIEIIEIECSYIKENVKNIAFKTSTLY